MSKFKYSDAEMDANKVLYMNQQKSLSLLNSTELRASRNEADDNIADSMELLRSLGKGNEVDALTREVEAKEGTRKLENKPVLESWEKIVAEANSFNPTPVVLEDIMTEAEINEAFKELDSINKEFSRKTKIINKTDLAFIAIAIAIHVTKALLFPLVAEKFDYGKSFDPAQRLDHNDKKIEKAHRDANDQFKEKNLKNHGTGYWINMLYQTPPYDITKGSKDLGINMGGKAHRLYTLGHDPILGWIFGTTNILTDCITFNTFNTNRITRVNPVSGAKQMIITPQVVPVGVMFKESYEMAQADYLNLPAAIFAQAQHYKSDEFTKMGLPVPLLASFNENFASKLYKEHYDALCFSRDLKIIGASFVVSKIIDIIIILTHRLFNKEGQDKDLYEVRTRKILLISNTIASTSSIILSSVTSNPKNLDIGSLLNTITHLFLDVRFIAKIKQEFIESEISNRLQAEIDEIDRLFYTI